jgi:hypothetical protein
MSARRAFALLSLLCVGAAGCGGSDGDGGNDPTTVNLTNFQAASAIIGQSLVTGSSPNNGGVGTNQVGLNQPNGHAGSGSLYVADSDNHRVLGFTSMPTGLGTGANFVLGQADFVTGTPGTSAGKMSRPTACWVAGNALFVADSFNRRVLVFSPPPTATNTAASLALGQPDLVSNASATTQNGMGRPFEVCVAANRIVVADSDNHRVLIWNGIPAVSGANAQLVLGQVDFVTTGSGTSATQFDQPAGVWTDGTRLAVADFTNNRVLIWTTFPTVNGQAADVVVGQPDFTTNTPGTGSQKMDNPISVASDGASLFVADSDNHRVLIFSPFPTASNPAATSVLGQSNFSNVAANDDDQNGTSDAAPSARTLDLPSGVTAIGNQLLVVDRNNHRVLIFTGS